MASGWREVIAARIREAIDLFDGGKTTFEETTGITRQLVAQYSDANGIKSCAKLDNILMALGLRMEATTIQSDAPPVTLAVLPVQSTSEGEPLTNTLTPEIVVQAAYLIDPLHPTETAAMLTDNGVKYLLGLLAAMTLEERTGMVRTLIAHVINRPPGTSGGESDPPARRSERRSRRP